MREFIDLEAYLRRIDHVGAVAPQLSTLRALAIAHAAAIPFENLNPLLGLPVSLEPAALAQKLLHDGRGGYCFEQNLLFMAALRAIGFEVYGLLARVLWMQPEDSLTAQSHMLLRVELDGETWLADVGFGGLTLTGALRLQPEIEQPTAHEPFRLVLDSSDGDWRMQALVHEQWNTLYRFNLQPHFPIDFVVGNHYVSTHPDSRFVNELIVARTLADRRLGLRNREFVVHRAGGSERRTLGSVAEIRQVLENEFLIRLPQHPELDRRLGSLPA